MILVVSSFFFFLHGKERNRRESKKISHSIFIIMIIFSISCSGVVRCEHFFGVDMYIYMYIGRSFVAATVLD